MRFIIATLAIVTTPWADAFTPTCMNIHRNPFGTVARNRSSSSSSLRTSNFDISIEYDAAAKLAYDDWRKKYNKGPFDESKYPVFRANYETVSIANVIALKKARDSGITEAVNDAELNESADRTLMQAGAVSLLENALASSAAQSEAAMAIEEAAAALAEDEQLLVEQLGLESVEELEVAIDSIEGIAQDGGELDTSNISREARIRSAYMEWCKEYGKTPDEVRFPNFSSNFLALEEYARVNNKEITLNKYADCTEEEYMSITSGSVTVPKKAENPPPAKAVTDVKLKKESVAIKVEEIKTEVTPKPASLDTTKQPAGKKVEEPKAEPVDVEKLKKLREQELEKAANAAKAAAEAEAIATAKAIAEKEAAQIAKRRLIEAEAVEKALEQAAKAQADLIARNAAKIALSSSKVAVKVDGPKTPSVPTKSIQVKEMKEEKALTSKSVLPPLSMDREPATIIEKPIAKTSVGETSKQPVITSTEINVSNPMTEAFASFFGSKASKTDPPVPIVQSKPKSEVISKPKESAPPAAVAEENESLSIFDFKKSDMATPSVEKKPQPRNEPAPPKKDATFPFFNLKPPSDEKPKIESTIKPPLSDLKSSKSVEKPIGKALDEASKKTVVSSTDMDISDPVTEAFASFFGSKTSKTEQPVKMKESKLKPEAITKSKGSSSTTVTEKKELLSIFDFKSAPPTVTTAPEPTTKLASQKKETAFSFLSLKPSSDDKLKAVTTKPEPDTKLPAPPKTKPVFSVFSSKQAQTKVIVEPVVPEVQNEKKKGNLFSVFYTAPSSDAKAEGLKTLSGKKSIDVSKKTGATTSKIAPTPAESKREPSFTLFSKPKPIESKALPLPVPPAASKKNPFQLFTPKTSSTGKLSVPPKTLSPPVKKDPPPTKVTAVSAKGSMKAESKLSVGNFMKGLGSGTISLASDRVTSSAITDDIPLLKNWKRESDGSITGNISNSKKFRNGAEITTSPVKGVIKSGSVVVTSSGSKYRLM